VFSEECLCLPRTAAESRPVSRCRAHVGLLQARIAVSLPNTKHSLREHPGEALLSETAASTGARLQRNVDMGQAGAGDLDRSCGYRSPSASPSAPTAPDQQSLAKGHLGMGHPNRKPPARAHHARGTAPMPHRLNLARRWNQSLVEETRQSDGDDRKRQLTRRS